jgi:hypothetical protein
MKMDLPGKFVAITTFKDRVIVASTEAVFEVITGEDGELALKQIHFAEPETSNKEPVVFFDPKTGMRL